MRVSTTPTNVERQQANSPPSIVEYATREQAQNAVQTLSNQNLMGRLVYVREVGSRSQPSGRLSADLSTPGPRGRASIQQRTLGRPRRLRWWRWYARWLWRWWLRRRQHGRRRRRRPRPRPRRRWSSALHFQRLFTPSFVVALHWPWARSGINCR